MEKREADDPIRRLALASAFAVVAGAGCTTHRARYEEFDEPSPFLRLDCKCESGPIAKDAALKAYDYHAYVTLEAPPTASLPPDRKPSADPKVIIEY